MIENGDKIAVGVSGGKDSVLLLKALCGLKTFYPKEFEIVAITLDMRFNNVDGDFSEIQKICNEYNVSRTPVREALRQLEMDGLIENIPNRGAFVIGFTDQDITDMYDLRRSYEVLAVRWAIERITEHEFNELEETFEFMEFYTMKNDIPKMLNINAAFRQIIYNATHNRMLLQQLTAYQLYLRHCDPSNYFAPGYLREVLSEHREIFESIETGDADAAAEAMRIHLQNSEARKFR
jgi:DNA-binding GntR family transcriptional regulator